MDIWKFYDITHRFHLICNPTSEEKLDRLIELVKLRPGDAVVDIASGKGEFLIRLVETYGVRALGIDISPYFKKDAEERARNRLPKADLALKEMNGADYTPEEPEQLALASCIGASWIFKGHRGTLEALLGMVRPGGWIVVGEPFWLKQPAPAYLETTGDKESDFGSHEGNVEVGEQLGLRLVHTLVSNQDDWDRYEGLQWYATEEYERQHPQDPDLSELLERVNKDKRAYLRWGRDTLGWAIYVFRRR